MNFRPLLMSLTLACAALFVRADQPKAAELPAPDTDGFISLFNGKDLSGWEGINEFWSVKDGAIDGTETKEHPAPQTDLNLSASVADPRKFSDFEYHYSFRFVTPTGNSGMQFRSQITDEKTHHCGGYQADCDAGNSYTGIIYDESGVAGNKGITSKRGTRTTYDDSSKKSEVPLSESNDQLKTAIKPIGDWNEAVVVARGNHITYTLNGHLMTDLTDNSPRALKDGVIGIQLHHGFVMEVQFKDLKIKFLDAK